MTNKENMTKLPYSYYIVRTQAGFKQALNDFNKEAYEHGQTEFMGYPKSYPSIIQFSFHPNMGVLLRMCEHVNQAKDHFQEILDALINA